MIDKTKLQRQFDAKRQVNLRISEALQCASPPHDWSGVWDNLEHVKNQHIRKGHPRHIADQGLFINAIADAIEDATPDELARIIFVLMRIEYDKYMELEEGD